MPLATTKTRHPLGHAGVACIFRCDHPGCSRYAMYGFGGSIRAALKAGDAGKGGLFACQMHREAIEVKWRSAMGDSAGEASSPATTAPRLL